MVAQWTNWPMVSAWVSGVSDYAAPADFLGPGLELRFQ